MRRAPVFDENWKPLILKPLMALVTSPFCLFMPSGNAATMRGWSAQPTHTANSTNGSVESNVRVLA